MLRSLFLFLKNLVGDFIAKSFVGAGLGIVSFAGLSALMLTALDAVKTYMGSLANAMLQMMLLLGVGEALTILGTAVMTRIAMQSAGITIGRVSRSS